MIHVGFKFNKSFTSFLVSSQISGQGFLAIVTPVTNLDHHFSLGSDR